MRDGTASISHFVIAGLDPAIHPFEKVLSPRLMDARIKSGHDGMYAPHASWNVDFARSGSSFFTKMKRGNRSS
jgi:hypothetical protein